MRSKEVEPVAIEATGQPKTIRSLGRLAAQCLIVVGSLTTGGVVGGFLLINHAAERLDPVREQMQEIEKMGNSIDQKVKSGQKKIEEGIDEVKQARCAALDLDKRLDEISAKFEPEETTTTLATDLTTSTAVSRSDCE